jgi:hypothetical protein
LIPTYGTCGIKVWVFKGEILEHDPMAQDKKAQEEGGRLAEAGLFRLQHGFLPYACSRSRRPRSRPPSPSRSVHDLRHLRHQGVGVQGRDP